jgi:hypothetical protein
MPCSGCAQRALERRERDVVEVALVEAHILHLALERLNHCMREVDLLEALRAPQPTGAEDIDLHQLITDDVEADEEHAVLHQLGPDDLSDTQVRAADFGLRLLSAGVDVASHVIARADAAKRRVFALVAQRNSVEQKEPRVAIFGGR